MSRWRRARNRGRVYRTGRGAIGLWQEPDRSWTARLGDSEARGAQTDFGALYQLALARMAAKDMESVEAVREALRALNKEDR